MTGVKSRNGRVLSGILLALLIVSTGACGNTSIVPDAAEPDTSQLAEEQVTEIASNALQAYNTGDYAAWSRDWSDTMKAAIPEAAFQRFREQSLPVTGRFVSISGVERTGARTPGYVRWLITAQFEKTPVQFSLVVPEDGSQIEGVNFEPGG